MSAKILAYDNEHGERDLYGKLTASELVTNTISPVSAEGTISMDVLCIHRGTGLMNGGYKLNWARQLR